MTRPPRSCSTSLCRTSRKVGRQRQRSGSPPSISSTFCSARECGKTSENQNGTSPPYTLDLTVSLELSNTVYALDATTIDLCLSVFPWAHFRTTKAAVKMHTLLDLRANIPSFIHISDGKLHDVHALDMLIPEAGAFYVMDRAYVDFARLNALHQAGAFFVTRAKSNMHAHRIYSAQTEQPAGIICDQTNRARRQRHQAELSRTFAPHPFARSRQRQDAGVH